MDFTPEDRTYDMNTPGQVDFILRSHYESGGGDTEIRAALIERLELKKKLALAEAAMTGWRSYAWKENKRGVERYIDSVGEYFERVLARIRK